MYGSPAIVKQDACQNNTSSLAAKAPIARRSQPFTFGVEKNELSVSIYGDGPPAVFIHGIGSNKTTWETVCPGLTDIFTCYVVDLPGSGDSAAPADFDYSLDSLAHVIKSLIVAVDLKQTTLVAHSFGAGVALLSLIGADESFLKRITRLCILDGICYPQAYPFFVAALRTPILASIITELVPYKTQVRCVLERCYYDKSKITDEQVAEHSRRLERADVRFALRRTAAQIDAEWLKKYIPSYKSIEIPTLLIWGVNDRIVPLYNGLWLWHDLPNSQMCMIENCGHMPQEECPDKTIEAIRLFVSGDPTRSSFDD
jgi:pimeloyl-ACP methyl ester carboxylesterase